MLDDDDDDESILGGALVERLMMITELLVKHGLQHPPKTPPPLTINLILNISYP